MSICPFCKCDSYEYVDVGIGRVPVAVVCCDLGIMLDSKDKTMSKFAWRILQLRRSHSPRKKARAKRMIEQMEYENE